MQAPFPRTVIILVVGVIAYLLVMIGMRRLTRWAQSRANRALPPFDMVELNGMRDEGKITAEEFERLRELIFRSQPVDLKDAGRAFEVIPRAGTEK